MMKLEDICVSFEYAKRLKEIGIKQESLFMWFEDSSFKWYAGQGLCQEKSFISLEFYKNCFRENAERYSAFTASELINILPGKIIVGDRTAKIIIGKESDEYKVWYLNFGWNIFIPSKENEISEISLSNALSKLLLYIIENKLVSLEEINERI